MPLVDDALGQLQDSLYTQNEMGGPSWRLSLLCWSQEHTTEVGVRVAGHHGEGGGSSLARALANLFALWNAPGNEGNSSDP